jgi:hypothetical protein
MRKNPTLDLCCLCCHATVNEHQVVVQTRGKQLYKHGKCLSLVIQRTLSHTCIFEWFRGLGTCTMIQQLVGSQLAEMRNLRCKIREEVVTSRIN